MDRRGTGRWLLVALSIFSLVLLTAQHASAYFLGDAADYVVFGFGTGSTVQLGQGPLTINGNVAVGQGADLTLGGSNVVVNGQIFYYDPIVSGTNTPGGFSASGGPFSLNGSACSNTATCLGTGQVIQDSATVGQAQTDLLNLYASVKGLSATAGSPTGNLTGTFAWTGNGGTNVASLTNFDYKSGDTLTLNGGANDFFIFNITDNWNMSSGSDITLNGVSSDHVLFNLLKTADGGGGEDIGQSGSANGKGIILALDRNVTMKGNPWIGRIFTDSDKTTHLFSSFELNKPAQVPQPAGILLLGSGLAGLAFIRRKVRTKS